MVLWFAGDHFGCRGTMHYPEWYKRISAPFREEFSVQAINVLDRVLVVAVAGVYVVSIMVLLASGEIGRALRVIAVPAATFALVSYLRERYDAPRPYELYDIDPIIVKDTHGKSMPSRHVASAVIIAFALAWIHLDWGVVAFAASAIVAFTRIVGGVHFPRDVAAGAGISLACGLIGFVLIP